ncbi:sensor histidine kinase [Dyadobacter sp. NIV53]|uniref:tetratricopeptide repeat-containing sensor histidine kinase n=1 Tax=Dyadobacter sp. NIV53 TaxID=2861765 RepID=UPI001C86D139|nr:sensor histidine kinase [Dyadobacter sp. NIV53]
MVSKIYSTILIITVCFLLSANALIAQTNTIPASSQNIYERLLTTQKEYEIAITRGDTAEIGELCYLLGKRYINIGHFSKAQQWLVKSLNIRKPNGPSENIGKIYLRMSEIQIFQSDMDEAERYVHLAKNNFAKINSLKGLMGAYRISGDIQQTKWETDREKKNSGSLDSACFYYTKSLKIASDFNIQVDMAVSYQCLGKVFELKNDIDNSILYKQKALLIYHKEKLMNNIVDLSSQIASDLIRRGKFAAAKQWLDKALVANKSQSAHLGIQVSLYETLTIYYEKTGNWQKAISYQKQVRELQARQFENYRNEAVENINLVYENELKSAELIAHGKEKLLQLKNIQIQKRLTNITLTLFLVASVLGILFYMLFIKYRKLSIQNAYLVKEQNHRTKNNLQSVSDLLSLQLYSLSDPHAMAVMEESLLRVQAMTWVHRSLYQGDKLVDVDLRSYISGLVNGVLQSYKLEYVTVIYEIEDIWLHTDKAVSLGLIVNELTTNACKYAFSDNLNPTLAINCTLKSDSVFLSFYDNGPGFKNDKTQTNFGLRLISILLKRLKASGTFTTDSGCCFTLSFQAEPKHAVN